MTPEIVIPVVLCSLAGIAGLVAIAWSYWSRDPVDVLRRAIMKGADFETCLQAARACFEDEILQTVMLDWQTTRHHGTRFYKPAALSHLMIEDERFDRWRRADPRHQDRFTTVILKIRAQLVEYQHAI